MSIRCLVTLVTLFLLSLHLSDLPNGHQSPIGCKSATSHDLFTDGESSANVDPKHTLTPVEDDGRNECAEKQDDKSSSDGKEMVASTGSGDHGAANGVEGEEEVIVIQDTGFNIKIMAPGVEPFDLPASLISLIIWYLFGVPSIPLSIKSALKLIIRSFFLTRNRVAGD